MKPKQILILGCVLAVLLGVLLIKNTLMKPRVEKIEYRTLGEGVNAGLVSTVKLKGALDKEPIRLEKKDNKWVVASKWNAPADNNKIEALINDFSVIRGELRSGNKDLLGDYGINDDEAYSVIFESGEAKKLNGFLIGMKRGGMSDSFIRRPGSNDVYLIPTDILRSLGIYEDGKKSSLNPDIWTDLALLEFAPEKVEEIKIVKKDGNADVTSLDLKKEIASDTKAEKWVPRGETAAAEIDNAKVQQFLFQLSELKARSVADPNGEGYGLDAPQLILTITCEGKPIELIVGNPKEKEGQEVYVKSPNGFVYLMPKYLNDHLMAIDSNKLAATPPPAPAQEDEPNQEIVENPPQESSSFPNAEPQPLEASNFSAKNPASDRNPKDRK